MKYRQQISLFTTLLCSLLILADSQAQDAADAAKGETACTMQYDPVCAQHSDGSLKTHATDCTACGKADVIGHIKGACPE